MIHDPPIFRPLGDRYLAVEFGDEAKLELNFKVIALASTLEEERLPGVVDIIPSLRQLAVVLDPSVTTHAKLRAHLEEVGFHAASA